MSECNKKLQAEGKAYPRTCAKCRLGPCLDEPDYNSIYKYNQEGVTTPYTDTILDGSRCLVIGAMEKDRSGGSLFRNQMEEKLSPMGIKVWNHYKKPIECSINEGDDELFEKLRKFREEENYEAIANYKQIRHNDLALIDKCDFVVCELNMEALSCGTWEELFWANRQKKPCFIFSVQGKKSIPIWLWWTLPTHYFYNDSDEIVEMLTRIHTGKIQIDSDRWKLLRKEIR